MKNSKGENNNNQNCGFAFPPDNREKLKESEKKDKYLDLARELKKNMEHAGNNYTICNGCFWNCN